MDLLLHILNAINLKYAQDYDLAVFIALLYPSIETLFLFLGKPSKFLSIYC